MVDKKEKLSIESAIYDTNKTYKIFVKIFLSELCLSPVTFMTWLEPWV